MIENLRQLSSSTRGTMQTGLLTSLLDYAIQKQRDESERNPVSVSPRFHVFSSHFDSTGSIQFLFKYFPYPVS